MILLNIFGVLLASVMGAFLYRFRGGWPDIKRPIEQALFCAPLLFIGVVMLGWCGLLPYGLCVWAVCKGHGRNADLGDWTEIAEREWYENNKPMKWLEGVLPPYWYDAMGLAVSGLTYTLPMIIVDALLGLSGALKAPAWMLGKLIAEKTGLKIVLFGGRFHVVTAWEWGEFLCGATLWGTWVIFILGVF